MSFALSELSRHKTYMSLASDSLTGLGGRKSSVGHTCLMNTVDPDLSIATLHEVCVVALSVMLLARPFTHRACPMAAVHVEVVRIKQPSGLSMLCGHNT